jgi:hypothetical protein
MTFVDPFLRTSLPGNAIHLHWPLSLLTAVLLQLLVLSCKKWSNVFVNQDFKQAAVSLSLYDRECFGRKLSTKGLDTLQSRSDLDRW